VRHIPEWLPWFSYKPLAHTGHNLGNQVLYPPLQFVKEGIVSTYCLDITAYQNGSQIVSQLDGTAPPSLALESFQEVEHLKLSGSDRAVAEDTIAAALASMYSGQYLLWCLDLVETILYNSRGRYCELMDKYL